MCGIGTVFALRAHPLPNWTIRSVRASGAPSSGRKQPPSTYRAQNFDGIEAPWVLSALPECLLPQSVFRAKSVGAVLAHLPAGARRVAPGTALTYRNCRIDVRSSDAVVTRGDDRFHIPPRSQLFRTPTKLVLLRFSGRAELRVYTLSNL